MPRFGSPYEICIIYSKSIPNFLMFWSHHICVFHYLHVVFLSLLYNFLAILINSCWKFYLFSVDTLIFGYNISNYTGISVAYMRDSIRIIYWCCYEKCISFHIYLFNVGFMVPFLLFKSNFCHQKIRSLDPISFLFFGWLLVRICFCFRLRLFLSLKLPLLLFLY